MLSEHCSRFRLEFQRGAAFSHLERCAPCRAWADGLARLESFGLDEPLPAGLRYDLSRIPEGQTEAPEVTFRPLPQAPLSAELRARLSRIPLEERRPLPFWLARTRYTAAASLLLAVLSAGFFGDALAGTRAVVSGLTGGVTRTLDAAEAEGSRALTDLGRSSRTRFERTRTTMQQSVDYVATRWEDLAAEVPHLKDEALPPEPVENAHEQSKNRAR